MDIRKLLSYVRQAAGDYELIEDNDRIAVGISGGKDSLALLYALKKLQRFYPRHFELTAVIRFILDLKGFIQNRCMHSVKSFRCLMKS